VGQVPDLPASLNKKKGTNRQQKQYLSGVTPTQPVTPTPKPLRLWPGVLAVTLQWFLRFVLPLIWADSLLYSVLGGLAFGLVIILWWAFFSRAPIVERWAAIVLMIGAVALTKRVVHPSIANGMMGMMLPVFAVPVLSLAFVVWAVATSRLSNPVRRLTLLATVLLACGAWTLVRTNGITAEAASDFKWRWAPTAEDRLLAQAVSLPAPIPAVTVALKLPAEPVAAPVEPSAPAPVLTRTTPDWPGFRGPHRDGIIPGVQIETDWSKSPPVQIWRRPIGPGWSSFAVHNGLLYTQEQRGADELVSCYSLTTGEPVWAHHDPVRFWESNAGPGPRGTPTIHNGRVYTLGATGIANALDAATGTVIWTRNASTDTGRKVPEWGFSSSPLIVDDLVIMAAAGKLVAYNIATGEPRWFGPDGKYGYSSPHPLTIDGVKQILLTAGPGVTSVSPVDGSRLWEHPLPANARIVQPAIISEGDLLVGEGEGQKMHRIAVTHSPAGWTVEERWTSIGLKPYFSDFVVHKDHAYGFDGAILSCIDLKDGKRSWKGGRYGSGQLVLLPDQEVLLVLAEEGDLALVSAAPGEFKELARVPAIEGKTWNHPVLAGDTLLVRNGQEMAAFRLSLTRH
jgi:hypothetical protein